MSVGNLFNEAWYLENNPDVREAVKQGVISAWDHYDQYGRFESRAPGPLFDPEYYLAQNPDVAAAVRAGVGTAYDHFMLYGINEARSFVSFFDVNFYLGTNSDVSNAAGGDPSIAVMHFLMHGQGEPRAISPFFDLRAYLDANQDVADAVAQLGASPLEHLLIHGLNEPRDLGNGINLAQFANDPVFKNAGTPMEALARIAEVAPFLPTFEPPAGWVPPANTPIPTNFVPVEGEKLVIPPSVVVPDDVEIPEDVFEPVEPGPGPQPEPEDPVGPGTPSKPKDFEAKIVEGELVFSNVKKGIIEVERVEHPEAPDDYLVVFSSGGVNRSIAEGDLDNVSISVPKNVTLRGDAQVIGELSLSSLDGGTTQLTGVSATGAASLNFSNANELMLTSIKDVVNKISDLTVKLEDSTIMLPKASDSNLLTYSDKREWKDDWKKVLTIDALGNNSLDLGNLPIPDIGYYLSDVTVRGDGGHLSLSTLYFGKESTTFDSTEYGGNVYLDAYVYHGDPTPYEWSIKFGPGNDTLHLHDAATAWDVPPTGAVIDGGDGDDENNTLVLEGSLYRDWANAKGQVTNFQTIEIAKGTVSADAKPNVVDAGNFEGAERIIVSGNALSVDNLGNQAVGFHDLEIDVVQVGFNGETGRILLSDVEFLKENRDTEIEVFGDNLKELSIVGSNIKGVLSIDVGYPGSKRADGGYAPNLEKVNLSVKSNVEFSIDGDNFGNIQFIDASGSTGGITADMAGNSDQTVPLHEKYSGALSIKEIKGGNGNDDLTARLQLFKEGSVTVELGDGDDTFTLYANEDKGIGGKATTLTVDLGTGFDTVVINGLGNILNLYEPNAIVIQQFSAGDVLNLKGAYTPVKIHDEFDIDDNASLLDVLNIVASGTPKDEIALFAFEADAYVYVKNSESDGLSVGDGLVKIVGWNEDLESLEVDISTS